MKEGNDRKGEEDQKASEEGGWVRFREGRGPGADRLLITARSCCSSVRPLESPHALSGPDMAQQRRNQRRTSACMVDIVLKKQGFAFYFAAESRTWRGGCRMEAFVSASHSW